MLRPWLMFVLVATSACARADGSQNSDATTTTADSKSADATIDSNGCATQPCSILPQCGCNGNTACDLDSSDGMGTKCRMIATPGTEISTCSTLSQCDKGFVCLSGGSCKKYCSADVDCGSPRGACVIDISSGGQPVADVPSVCSSNCDPISTNPPECPSTFKCGLFTATHNGSPVKISDCSLAGAGVQGDSCASGANGSDALCAKGYLCSTVTSDSAFKCRRICKPNATPTGCGTATCLKFNPVFTIGNPAVEYGICQ